MIWEKYDIRNLDDSEYKKWYSLMDAEKKMRVDRFCFIEDKKRTVAAEMLSRKMISDWCKTISPEKISFGKTEYGKPFAIGLDVHFNVSHSGNMVVCAIDKNPVGIDVEKIREYKFSVAKRVCSAEEILFIEQSENPAKEFIKIWTMKEAYAKFSGTGLTQNILKQKNSGDLHQSEFDDYVVSIFQSE